MYPTRWSPDQNFDISPYDFMHPFYDMHPSYYRPWWHNQTISKEFRSTIENEKGNYKITLNVQHFRPHEINVKATANEIIVEGKHEERADTHGFVTREFKRRYPLPNHCSSENVTSSLSADGVLTIIAEKTASQLTEKIVPIKMDGGWRTSRKTPIETEVSSEITQTKLKENIKDTECSLNKKQSDLMIKEDHSRLLKGGLLRDTNLSANGACTEKTEKTDDITRTSNKIEETIGKSILGLTALTEQLGRSSSASTSKISGMKEASEMASIKTTTEVSGGCGASEATAMKSTDISSNQSISGVSNTKIASDLKSKTEMSDIKTTSNISSKQDGAEMYDKKSLKESCAITGGMDKCGIKDALQMCSIKNLSEQSGMNIASDKMCVMKEMSKITTEESMSCTTQSSISSSTRISGKTSEQISDICAELREAAESV